MNRIRRRVQAMVLAATNALVLAATNALVLAATNALMQVLADRVGAAPAAT
jgi:hypothetical protein